MPMLLLAALGLARPAFAQHASGFTSQSGHLVFSVDSAPSARALTSSPPPWWIGPDPATTETRIVTEFLTQLPIERVQRALGNPRALRLVGAGMGAAVVSYACTRSEVSAEVVYAGVQAIRFAGGETLNPRGFHIEPSVGGGGLAVYVRRRL